MYNEQHKRVSIRHELVVDVHAGEGGDDAKAFASELADVYKRWCKLKNFQYEILDETPSKVSLHVRGRDVWKAFRNERGKHTVQRIPSNQRKAKPQTSVVSVAVTPLILPEEFRLNFDELEITTTKGSGKGGQHRNKRETAVRIKHLPTGTMVLICNERSQEQNKAIALEILASKLKAVEEEAREDLWSSERRRQMGGGHRSDKRRTYNFIKGWVEDHVLSTSTNDIKSLMRGHLELLL